MALSADQYRSAWERDGEGAPHFNSRLIPGSCVLETLAMVNDVGLRWVFVDDFGYAVSYCWHRLRADLVPPEQRAGASAGESSEQWRRMRSAFAPEDLAMRWVEVDSAFTALLSAFISGGYAPALGSLLREVVNRYGLDLELGEVYVLPEDLAALLEQIGNPFVWWDDAVERAEQESTPFDFANEEHRAVLARRLCEQNRPD